jgi:hypothetical protein
VQCRVADRSEGGGGQNSAAERPNEKTEIVPDYLWEQSIAIHPVAG